MYELAGATTLPFHQAGARLVSQPPAPKASAATGDGDQRTRWNYVPIANSTVGGNFRPSGFQSRVRSRQQFLGTLNFVLGRSGRIGMSAILIDVLLFAGIAAFYIGIVIAAANLLLGSG